MKMTYPALAALIAVPTVPAGAQMVRAQDPQTLVAALQEAGYAAKLETDKGGEPMITSNASGTKFFIDFYNCTNSKNCTSVTFHTGYDLKSGFPLEKINVWNSSNRFGRAYLDKENDPIIEMDVDLDDGGMSRALFLDNLEFWTGVLGSFERHIGYRS